MSIKNTLALLFVVIHIFTIIIVHVFIRHGTFSKYLISYSKMMPLVRSGSCQDTAMLFFDVLPFFTTVIGDGAGNITVTFNFHLKSSRKYIFLRDAAKS